MELDQAVIAIERQKALEGLCSHITYPLLIACYGSHAQVTQMYVLCPCHSAFEKGPARIETSGPEYFAIRSLLG